MSSYKCSACNYVSNNKDNAKKHIAKVCGKDTKDKDTMLIKKIVKLECNLCNKTFDTEKLLAQHKERCFQKRVVPVTIYTDTSKVEEFNKNVMVLINSLQQDNQNLLNEVKELKKRLDKVEGTDKEEDKDSNDEENLCEHHKVVKFIPTSREQIKTVLKEHECEDCKNIVVTINGQRNLEINALVQKEGIEVDGTTYHYNADKKEKSTKDLKVIIKKYCSNSVKSGHIYCKEHN